MLFVIPLAIGLIVQSLFYGISVVWVSIAIGTAGICSVLKNRLIYLDSLTGVYNTTYLQKLIRTLENKENQVLSAILIDINDFKKINDTLGHDAGDIALESAAAIFYRAVNDKGQVIRNGGDEFLILVYSRDPVDVARISHEIERECYNFTKDNEMGFNLSVSMGSGAFDNKKESFDTFLKHLDVKMYENKKEYHKLNDDPEVVRFYEEEYKRLTEYANQEHRLANKQRMLRSFGDMVNAALWTIKIDANNKLTDVDWSAEFIHMIGCDENEETVSKTVETWTSRLYPDDLENTMAQFNKAIASRDFGQYVYDAEYRIQREDGVIRWYHGLARIEDEGDGNRMLIGIMIDITEKKALEKQKENI